MSSDQEQKPAPPSEETALVEERDFLFENGLMVLTRHYLLRRGYCCGNGCRNRPYASALKR